MFIDYEVLHYIAEQFKVAFRRVLDNIVNSWSHIKGSIQYYISEYEVSKHPSLKYKHIKRNIVTHQVIIRRPLSIRARTNC